MIKIQTRSKFNCILKKGTRPALQSNEVTGSSSRLHYLWTVLTMKHKSERRAPAIPFESPKHTSRQILHHQKAVDAFTEKKSSYRFTDSFSAGSRKKPHLPPHVQQQFATLTRRSFSVYKYLNKHQLIALVFVLMIGCAYATDASMVIRETRRTRTGRKTIDKESLYADVCTNTSLQSINKPDIRLALSASGEITPKSCLTLHKTAECSKDILLWLRFTPDTDRLDRVYGKSMTEYQSWKSAFLGQWELLNPDLHAYDETTERIWRTIGDLAMLHHSVNAIDSEKGGQCADHAKAAIYKLLQHKYNHGLDTRIQRVQLGMDAYAKTVDHMYVLVDSDAENLEIQDDPVAVRKALQAITHGKICDTWNQGYYGDFVSDVSGFYHNRDAHHSREWRYLSIDTFTIDFSVLNDLPEPMKQFFCEQIHALGISAPHESACLQFFGRASTTEVLTEVESLDAIDEQGLQL
ncbi:hypothetical protein E3226_005950 [Legionella geestiana]|uniref:hypothetical protein n=1 Tax=Legionella geestiana TaxID=45065 RepID=UPI0011804F19|nr:hypothetical protein [Legionella geestiana]QDQ39971.1 hypothetical protein E3226_005950 [Legionella geestiana]